MCFAARRRNEGIYLYACRDVLAAHYDGWWDYGVTDILYSWEVCLFDHIDCGIDDTPVNWGIFDRNLEM